MSTLILLLILSFLVAPMTAVADRCNTPNCSADANACANALFVKAAKLIQKAEEGVASLGVLKNAQGCLQAIIDDHASSDLAVRLVSGQEIGNVSVAILEAKIEVREKQINQKTCSGFCEALRSALDIQNHKARDPVLAGIARMQVRANSFEGALETVELIVDGDERKRLRRYFLRAKARAALRCERSERMMNCH